VVAHYNLSLRYAEGKGVERDPKKEVYHLEEAAIGGDPQARYNLAAHEWNNVVHERGRNGRRIERAMKHWIIAAILIRHW
jgi:TPR repeat protein